MEVPKLRKGIDLHIDRYVHELCEVSNRSSTSTRSVMYLLVVSTIIQLLVFLNTFKFSWNTIAREKRLVELEQEITSLDMKGLENLNPVAPDLRRTLLREKVQLDKFKAENFGILRVPILNIPIHVNDTGLLAGIILTTLLIILRFTLEREETNLKISLKAVTNRYTDEADSAFFDTTSIEEDEKISRTDAVALINKTRRSYHYNFLTMNEIFTKPNSTLTREENKSPRKWKEFLLNNKYWISAIIYTATCLHDLLTIYIGFDNYGIPRTIGHYVALVIAGIFIFVQTHKCSKITKSILKVYNDFQKSNYQLVPKVND